MSGAFPDCDLDGNGDLHVVWRYPAAITSQNQGVHYAKFLTSSWDGSGTPPKAAIPETVSTWGCDYQFSQCRVAADPNDNAHVVWGEGRPWDKIFYRGWNGSSWDTAETILNVGTDKIASNPDIGVDSNSTVHVILKYVEIRHLCKSGGVWSGLTTISSAGTKKKPRIAVAPNDSVHAIYRPDSSLYLGYNRRAPNGVWGTEQILSPFAERADHPYITTDSASSPIIVWDRWSGPPDWKIIAVRQAQRSGASWADVDMPTDGDIGERDEYEHKALPNIGVSGLGNKFVCWLDYNQIKYAVYESGAWSPSEAILPSPAGNLAWPTVAFRGEVGYVVYKNDADSMLYVNRITFDDVDVVFDSFSPSETMDQTPDCSVGVQSPGNGINPSTAQAKYSTDGGSNWNPHPAVCTGPPGTTEPQTITALAVPFNQDSQTLNKIRFSIEDALGREVTSGDYNVAIGGTPPPDWDALYTGTGNQLPQEEDANWNYTGSLGDCSVSNGIMTVTDTDPQEGGCWFSWGSVSGIDPDVGITMVYRARKTNSAGENFPAFSEIKTGHAKDAFLVFSNRFATERQAETISMDTSQWHIYRILAHRGGMAVYIDEAPDYSLLVIGWNLLTTEKAFGLGFADWNGSGTVEIDWAAAAFTGLYVPGSGPALPEQAPTATPTHTPTFTPTHTPFPGEKGDMEPDSDHDLFDILRLVDIVLGIPPAPNAHELWAGDLDSDGDRDLFDILAVVDLVLES